MTALAFPALRPMKLPELLDRAIRLYRQNFLQFIGIVAVPYIPLMLLQAASSLLSTSSLQSITRSSDPTSLFSSTSYWLGLAGGLAYAVLHLFLIQGLATAALTRAIADSYMGQPVGVLSSYRGLGSSGWRLIGALLWLGLIGLGVIVWLMIPCLGWFSGPGLFVFVVWVVLPLVAPIVVLESSQPIASVRRAWDLARSRFWWLLGFALILYLFSLIVVSGPSMLIGLVFRTAASAAAISQPLDQQLMIETVIQSLATMVTGLLYLPLQLSAITVVYFDLRVRSEGLDLAVQSASGQGSSPLQVLELAPAGARAKLITGTDIAYFVLLSFGFGAIYALFIGLLAGLGLAMSSVVFPTP